MPKVGPSGHPKGSLSPSRRFERQIHVGNLPVTFIGVGAGRGVIRGYQRQREREGPLGLLVGGNIITLKGVDLDVEALRESRRDAQFTLVGAGNYVEAAKEQGERLDLSDRLAFRGHRPRQEVLRMYAD